MGVIVTIGLNCISKVFPRRSHLLRTAAIVLKLHTDRKCGGLFRWPCFDQPVRNGRLVGVSPAAFHLQEPLPRPRNWTTVWGAALFFKKQSVMAVRSHCHDIAHQGGTAIICRGLLSVADGGSFCVPLGFVDAVQDSKRGRHYRW